MESPGLIILHSAIYKIKEKYAAEPGSDRLFKNGDFAFFISISVIYALEHCGEEFEHPLN